VIPGADDGDAGLFADSAVPSPVEKESPHYHGHRDRLREKFAAGGGDALPDYELLELVLFRAIPRRDVKPLAKALVARFGSFAEVVSAEPARLMEVEGVSAGVASDLKVIEAAARRLARGAVRERALLD
jgi:DNA repair protein RadC